MNLLAVTIDFHNTIAQCDEWFELEVGKLPSAFLDWLVNQGLTDSRISDRGQVATKMYREIREEVHRSGNERDAADCLAEVCTRLRLDVPAADIDRGLVDIFRPTLNTSEPMPGAIELVNGLASRGYSLAIVSSAAYHEFVEWTLCKFGIRHHFEQIVTSASSGRYKSSPEIYRIAAKSLGVDPAQCLHIGDSLRFDVNSAATTGMRTMFVNWDNRTVQDSCPTSIVSDLFAAARVIQDKTGCAV